MAQISINCDMINSKSLLNLKHTIKPPMEQEGDGLCPATTQLNSMKQGPQMDFQDRLNPR